MGSGRGRIGGALTALLAGLLLPACYLGAPAGEYPVATRPAGAHLRLEVAGRQVTGELLDVGDARLLLLRDSDTTLVRLPADGIQGGTFVGPRAPGGDFRRPPPARELERWRWLSRFPQGVSEPLLGRLLEAYGQGEVEAIGAGSGA